MKILFLTSSMEGGGAERVAALLCNAWAQQGHEITLMPTFSGRGNCSYKLNQKVNLKYLADLVNGSTGKLKRLWALRKYYIKTKPDVIVSFLPEVNIAALLSAKGTGIPVIISERIYPKLDEHNLGKLTKYLRGKIYHWSKTVVVQTAGVEDWVLENCPKSKTTIIPNPVVYPLPVANMNNSPEEWLKPNRRLILGTGRLHPQKRFSHLINAFASIAGRHPNWDLAIVGEGVERSDLENLRQKHGLEDRIFLTGFTGSPASWYEKAEIYILSSAYEGFPNTLLEAMSYGVPSIAFDIKTGPSDLITHNQTGLILADDNHVEKLEKALEQLISNEAMRKKLSKNAIFVRKEYEMKNILKIWSEILNG